MPREVALRQLAPGGGSSCFEVRQVGLEVFGDTGIRRTRLVWTWMLVGLDLGVAFAGIWMQI